MILQKKEYLTWKIDFGVYSYILVKQWKAQFQYTTAIFINKQICLFFSIFHFHLREFKSHWYIRSEFTSIKIEVLMNIQNQRLATSYCCNRTRHCKKIHSFSFKKLFYMIHTAIMVVFFTHNSLIFVEKGKHIFFQNHLTSKMDAKEVAWLCSHLQLDNTLSATLLRTIPLLYSKSVVILASIVPLAWAKHGARKAVVLTARPMWCA